MQKADDIAKTSGLEHSMLECLTTAVLMIDLDMRLRSLNPAAEDLLGISSKRILGHRVTDIFPEAKDCPGVLLRALQSDQSFTEHEMQLCLSNQKCLTVNCTVTPIRNMAGLPNGVLVELARVDRQARIAREEEMLNQNQTVLNLIRGLAHEIKNPLGGLRGAAQLLEKELPSRELRDYTQIIIHEADRLQSLLDRMLGPRGMPRKRNSNIHEIMDRVCVLIGAEKSDGIDLVCDFDPSIPEMEVDPDLLIQAQLNMARNALQAMGDSGRLIMRTRVIRNFTIHQQRHRLAVRVDIMDDGGGIPEELLPTIFFPLVTGRADGTGLGLSIAQSLINRHGGLVQCQSRPGETVFSTILPLKLSRP